VTSSRRRAGRLPPLGAEPRWHFPPPRKAGGAARAFFGGDKPRGARWSTALRGRLGARTGSGTAAPRTPRTTRPDRPNSAVGPRLGSVQGHDRAFGGGRRIDLRQRNGLRGGTGSASHPAGTRT